MLCPLLRAYVVEHLGEEHTDARAPVRDAIGWLEAGDTFLMDRPWFDRFPPEIAMAGVVAALGVLEAAQR